MEFQVKNHGAELYSVIIDNVEYIWNKPEIWAKSSPVLFPFIGMIKDTKYSYKDKIYTIDTRHGFARDNEFECVKNEKDHKVYSFKSNESTLEKYPFEFEFLIEYKTISKNQLEIKYIVKNLSNEKMYFSVGGHPAFYLEGNYNDYYIELDNEVQLNKYEYIDTNYLTGKKIDLGKSKTIDITDEIFVDDAIVFDGNITNKSVIKSKKSNKKITVDHTGFPYIAYWRPLKANFVCIEPWYGITDEDNTNGDITKKLGIQELEASKEFEAKLILTFEN